MAHILVIDDDQEVLQLLTIMLEHEGYQVSIAADGFQGLKIARNRRPDLVLLDLMLPGIDGFEVCSRLRKEPTTASVPVLIVSAKSQQTDRAAGAKVGANGYLTKPYQRKELMAQIRTFLDQSQAASAASPTGIAVTLVGARESDGITTTIVNTAVALAGTGACVTLVDLRPFSVEHCLLSGLTPRAAPFSLAKPELAMFERDGLVTHPSGLRLLNNLEGSGEVGQITSADAVTLLDGLLPQGGYVLLSLPLYPIELLRDVAARSNLIVVATPTDPAGLAAARSALGLLDRLGIGSSRIGLIFIGDTSMPAPGLGREVLATVPAAAGVTEPALAALVTRLRDRAEKLAGNERPSA